MITRRNILKLFGLGGAAAAVAPAVAKAVSEPAPLPAFDPYTERTAEGVPRMECVEYAGSMLEDMPPVTLETHRRTGRTTRGLLEAIERAREGMVVAYVVAHQGLVSTCKTLAFRHARAISGGLAATGGGRPDLIVVHRDSRAEGGGVPVVGAVRIVVNREPRWPVPSALRGFGAVFYDHAWEEAPLAGTAESIAPDSGYRFCSPRYVCNSKQCGKPIPHDVHDGCILDRAGWYGDDERDPDEWEGWQPWRRS
jgi:hypothetical protein